MRLDASVRLGEDLGFGNARIAGSDVVMRQVSDAVRKTLLLNMRSRSMA
jgi:hypothetical protein